MTGQLEAVAEIPGLSQGLTAGGKLETTAAKETKLPPARRPLLTKVGKGRHILYTLPGYKVNSNHHQC